MKNLFSVFLFLIITAPLSHAISLDSLPSSNSALLEMLDKQLTRRNVYVDRRISMADSLKALIASHPGRSVELYSQLGAVYEPINCDSAISAYSRGFDAAVEIGDSVSAQRFLISRASELRKFGATPDAINTLEHIQKMGIYPENRRLYLFVARDHNLYLAEILDSNPVAKSYLEAGAKFASEQLEVLPADSHEAQITQALIYYIEGKRSLSAAVLQPLVSEIDFLNPLFSYALTVLGGQYYYMGDKEDAVHYWTLAALSDVYRGDIKGSALIRLGQALYDLGDIPRAHNYLSVALDEAIVANDKTNTVLVSESLMPVAQELSVLSNRRFMMMIGLILALVVVILLLAILYTSKKRRIREVEQVKHQLANSNRVKETYISEFINLCSSYIGSLEDFNRVCRRKITAGQADDLLKYLKDRTVVEEQRKKFDDIFDESFLAIYPSFLADLNRLLLPEKQISVSGGNVLTTELRVLAFSRLGVDDTARVARFLGVSNNTIYTYRNKFRNMAINRETFDADILKIGSIDQD